MVYTKTFGIFTFINFLESVIFSDYIELYYRQITNIAVVATFQIREVRKEAQEKANQSYLKITPPIPLQGK